MLEREVRFQWVSQEYIRLWTTNKSNDQRCDSGVIKSELSIRVLYTQPHVEPPLFITPHHPLLPLRRLSRVRPPTPESTQLRSLRPLPTAVTTRSAPLSVL